MSTTQAITVEKDEVVGQKEEIDPVTKQKKMVDVKTRKRVPSPRSDGHGFGVVAADLNDDGLIDLYVANDMNPHFLFLNRGDGTFEDVSEASGPAFDNNGRPSRAWGSTPRTSTATAFRRSSPRTSPTSTPRST